MNMPPAFICPYARINLSLLNSGVKICCWHNETVKLDRSVKVSLAQLWQNHDIHRIREKLSSGPYHCQGFCPVLNGCSDIFYPPNGLLVGNRMEGLSILQIDYTLSCNLACVMCNTTFEKGDLLLSPHALEELVTEAYAACPELLVILQGGEPFYRDKASAFARRVTQKCPNIRWGFITNLLEWSPGLVKGLKLAGMVVSVDGACRATYENIRRGGNWDRLLENITHLVQLYGENTPLQINYTVMTSNIGELSATADFFQARGIKLLRFRPVLLPAEHPEFIFSWPEAVSLLEDEAQKLKKHMGNLVDLRDLELLINLAKHFGAVTKPYGKGTESSLWDSLMPVSSVHSN
jgi:hypothetical protein